MEKRLVRNVQDKKIAGVCAGIGDYFNMDHTLVRALWIIFTLLGGSESQLMLFSTSFFQKAMQKLKPQRE